MLNKVAWLLENDVRAKKKCQRTMFNRTRTMAQELAIVAPFALLMTSTLHCAEGLPKRQPEKGSAASTSVSGNVDGVIAPLTPRTKRSSRLIPSPAEIRRQGNRLKNQRSLYLSQHAHNPIDWFPWGKEALALAIAEDKPIFLSIGYSSCHWCHVMEKNVFEKEDVAAYMNENYINIKVDREDRPDLDAVYMEALQLMTGGGGWPMSMFLASDLKPFFGGTYMPAERFMRLAKRLQKEYANNREWIASQGKKLYQRIARDPQLGASPMVDLPAIKKVADDLVARLDPQWGGSRGRMKFPTTARWQFLLHAYRKTGEKKYAHALRLTLDNMASGGMYDHLAGGFHRYTTEATWLVPHFEKMLYDNAQLASLYTEAATTFNSERYAEVARGILDFLIKEMSGETGGFYSSYDADSGGHEGSFYVWTLKEINKVVGQADAPLLSELLGLTVKGNFEGKTILTRRADIAKLAAKYSRSVKETSALLSKHRSALRKERAKRHWPGLDRKVVTSWNGLTIAAFAQAYRAFGEPRYLDAARRAADFLLKVHKTKKGGLLRSSTPLKKGGNSVAEHEGILDDYAFLADGLLQLFESSGDLRYLQEVLGLVVQAEARFRHADRGFYFTPKNHEVPLGRTVRTSDWARPSGAAVMLRVLLRLAATTGDEAMRERLDGILRVEAKRMKSRGLDMVASFDAALMRLGPFYEVVIAANPDAPNRKKLLQAVRSLHPYHALALEVPARGPNAKVAKLLASTAGKKALRGKATAYVCKFGSCKRPTNDPLILRRQLLEGYSRPSNP
jgi:uncharacterized protein